MRARTVFLQVCVCLAAVLLAGCPNKQVIQDVPTVEQADDQTATCKVAKDPLNPLIVEWPGTEKTNLASASQHGVVVVSYAGCTLKVLSTCNATGAYAFTPVTPARDKLQIANTNDLYAKLPLGVANLKAELEMGSSLELDYVAVGQRIVEKPPRAVSGDCEGATHYVRTITVGAYSLDAKAKGKAAGGLDVQGAGAGLGREEQKRKLRASGDVDACASAPSEQECGAVLQLGLAPLSANRGGQVTAAGFGANIGPLGNVPTVSELPDVQQIGAHSLRNVDVDYLSVVQDAKRLDKDASQPTANKIAAWKRVRDMRADGAYYEVAVRRVDEWTEVAAAETRRREQLDRLRAQYTEDKSKLDQLLRMDDDLVPKAQKAAYEKEFSQVYAPYENDLRELGLVARGASASGTSSGSTFVASSSGNSPPPDSGPSDLTGPPKIGEEIFIIKADGGFHAQSFSIDDDVDSITTTQGEDARPSWDLTGGYVGGTMAVNFSQTTDLAIGFIATGRYYLQAKGPTQAPFPSQEEASGAFSVTGGLQMQGPIAERVGLNLGFDVGAVKFLEPSDMPKECRTPDTIDTDGDGDFDSGGVSTPIDPDPMGGQVDLFVGFDFYPVKFMSLGILAALGWGHVNGQTCHPQTNVVVDGFGESFSATGGANLGFHF